MANEDVLFEEKRIRAWTGSRESLRRLGDVVGEQFRDERERLARRNNKRIRKLSGQALRIVPFRKAESNSDEKSKLCQVQLNIRTRKNYERTDEYNEILKDSDLEFKSVANIALGCFSEGRSCIITFSNGTLPGCWIRVSGDRHWVPGAARAITEELDRGKPWWAFLRHPLVGMSLMAFIGPPLIFGLVNFLDWITSKFPNLPDVAEFTLIIIPLFAFGAGIWPVATFIGRHALPAFEIAESGSLRRQQRVARAIGLAGGVFLSAISILQGIFWLKERIS